MEYTTFGKTGRKVSRIGFGGAVAGLTNYLRSYDPHKDEDRIRIIKAIHKALELGVNYFDTAPTYGKGDSEEIVGEALKDVKSNDIFLASKVNIDKNVRQSVEESLKRLQRDSIDLIQIHGLSFDKEQKHAILKSGGTLDQLLKLKQEGLIKYIGFTSEDNNLTFYKLIETKQFDMVQLCYNFLFQHPYEPSRPFGSLYETEKLNMGIAVMRAPTSGTFQRWINMVNPANTFDYTPALIQFVLSNPLVDVALIGMSSPERVEQNVAICNDLIGRIDINKVHTRYI